MPAKRTPPPPPTSEVPPPGSTDGAGAPPEIEVEPRNRTAKFKKLEEAMSGIYILVGGGLSTLPPQVMPVQFKSVGLSLASSSDEIASAWTDLAEDDPRVRKMLESLTSVSGWGKVIGVHLIAIGAGVPGVAAVMPGASPQPQQPNGAPPMADMETMLALGELLRMAQSEQRAPEPAPAAPAQAPPFTAPPPEQQQPAQRRAQPAAQATGRPRAGMPSPADMGVSVPDTPMEFPTAGPENIRG